MSESGERIRQRCRETHGSHGNVIDRVHKILRNELLHSLTDLGESGLIEREEAVVILKDVSQDLLWDAEEAQRVLYERKS